MHSIQTRFLYISLFFIFTQGLWERLFPGAEILPRFLIEVSVISFIFVSRFKKKIYSTPGLVLFLLFLLFSFFTYLVNSSSFIWYIRYVRYFLYFYLIYYCMYNNRISCSTWKKIFRFIFYLILLQGIGSFFTIAILGKRVEGYIGLMSSLGGTTGTIFPLFIIALSLTLYLFLKQKNKKLNLALILSSISAFLVAYQSLKRAIYLILPIFVFLIILLSFFENGRKKHFKRKMSRLIVLLFIVTPVYFFGILSVGGISKGLKGNETRIEILKNAIDYSATYSNDISYNNLTMGRISTTNKIINESLNNWHNFLFGKGYGEVKNEVGLKNMGVMYGIVGYTSDIVTSGWIFMILVVLLMITVIFKNNSYQFIATKYIRITIFLVWVYTHFFYSTDFTYHLKLNILMAIIFAFINSPKHKESLLFYLNKIG